MSGYKTHFFAGLIVTALAAFVLIHQGYLSLTIENVMWLTAISLIFSLLPDIDIGTSMIRKVAIIGFVIFIILNGLTVLGYLFAAIVIGIQFLKHRGIAHSFIVGACLSGLLYLYFWNWTFPIVAMLNFTSHLVLDEQ